MTPKDGQLIELAAWRCGNAIGWRYLFRPEDDLWVGVDVAVGPEDAYAKFQVGHAW